MILCIPQKNAWRWPVVSDETYFELIKIFLGNGKPPPHIIIFKHRELVTTLVVEWAEPLCPTLDTLFQISIRRPAIPIEIFHGFAQHSGQMSEYK
jgi:hypothetical protein